jgi:hypothetical protein
MEKIKRGRRFSRPERGRGRMRKEAMFVFVLAAATFCYLVTCDGEGVKAGAGQVKLRVLYVGYPGTEREKDFVGFLEKHFTKVGKADLAKVEVKDAEGYDVVVLDYGELIIKGNAIVSPRVVFGREYSRPVLMIGAAGALVCDSLGLKTGYL